MIIAEDPARSNEPVGMALYFFTFSTWTGKPSLYLEDVSAPFPLSCCLFVLYGKVH